MTVGLRAKVNRRQKLAFLDYAASWWSLHLVATPPGSKRVVDALQKFLTGQWVLIWIEILAVGKQLRVLVQASKNLLIYCAKQESFEARQEQHGNRLIQQDLFKSWAVDLVKIVGKFGTLLQRDSGSIYKLIPPFCPQSSSIYQQFGKSEARHLAVSGLSTSDWDDSLARLSTGIGTYTASILAEGSQIAILTSVGNTFLYDSSIFDEGASSPIRHNEPVYRIALNSAGTLLATYGYRTTKVWQISTGKCKVSIDNDMSRSRPLAMQFCDNDTTVLVGTDDRRLRSINLNQSTPGWELLARLDEPELEGHLFFVNSASHMALNPDGSLIAIAYRGHPTAAWEVDGQFHIGHCWLRGREKVSYGEVIDICWHPHFPELIGLYLEGVVFKWRPYEDTCEELPVTGVSRLQISKDGNLFATGDVHGTVKVYTTADLKLIYQLSSQDPVLGLVFSPDLRRFYDIRGYYGNAWEPNALMRFAEQTDKFMDNDSETESLAHTSTASVSACHWIDSVTTLSTSPTGSLYCFGTEKGVVKFHHTKQGQLDTFKASKSYLSIEAMCWSSDGRYVSFSDSSKTLFVHSIRQNSDRSGPIMELKVQVPMKMSTGGHISQILFSESSDCVLVYTISRICSVSVATSEIIHTLELSTPECKWMIHPQDAELIVGFGASMIQVLDWDLKIRHICGFESSPVKVMPFNPSPTSGLEQCTVDRVLVTHDKEHVLVQMSTLGQNSKEKLFYLFETSSFSTVGAAIGGSLERLHRNPITPMHLPQELSAQTTLALSFLPGNRLISLSRNFSVCSWQLSLSPGQSQSHQPKLHRLSMETPRTDTSILSHVKSRCVSVEKSADLFSLPGDWISRECLALCSIWSIESSLLCPRNGEVAVVRCADLT
jgi:WD40 repeat protein